MILSHCVWTVLLLSLWLTGGTWGFVPPNTVIDCQAPREYLYPNINEGYSGTLERINTPPDASLTLESPSCPVCLSFLDLSYTPGDAQATVNTKKPLDAEALTENSGALTYSIVCMNTTVSNMRTLPVTDMNDNGPVFEKDVYSVRVSEVLPVGGFVVQVKATDADVSPVYNSITYSIEPPSETFEVTTDGSVVLKKQLNYPVINSYSFTVTAKDIGGNSNTTTVIVKVYGGPYFEHKIYNATIPENKVGVFHTITPAPIKAYGEDAENNQVIIYNISTVHPSDYWENFIIDSTGVITVQKELDHEKTSTVNLAIQASLENDKEKTANAMVTVKVEDVNEPPVFIHEGYIIYIDHVVSEGSTFVVVKARDPDIGDKLHYSLVEPSSLFDVDSYTGLIYAVSAIYSGEETLKVKATDQHGLYAITKVEVTVDIDPGNVVRIVINKPADTVMDLVRETEKALQKALGLKVMIIDITSTSTGDVLVSFMATDTTGSVVTSDNLKNDLRNNKDKVQAELQDVFGPDTDFDIVEESRPNKTLEITLGILIPVICIVTILFAVFRHKLHFQKKEVPANIDMRNYEHKAQAELSSTPKQAGGNDPSAQQQIGMSHRGSDGSINRGVQF